MNRRLGPVCVSGSLVVLLGLLGACAGSGVGDGPPRTDLDGTEAQVARTIGEAVAMVRAAPSAATWGNLAETYDAHGFHVEASECYRRALELEPDRFEWAYHLAVVSDRQSAALDEVAARFARASELRPGYAPLWVRFGMVMSRRGEHGEAADLLRRAVRLAPDLPGAHRALGQELVALGDVDAAIESLERATALDPDDSITRAALAQAYRLAGDSERAQRAALDARRLRPRPGIRDPLRSSVAGRNVSSVALSQRAVVAMNAADHERAIELLEQSDRAKPDSVSTNYNLGLSYWRTGRVAEARSRFEIAISINDDPRSHWRLGGLLLEQGATEAALVHLRTAIAAAPTDTELLGDAAASMIRAGLLEEALPVLEQAAAIDTENARLQNNWGSALFQSRRAADALQKFERALELDPDYAMAAFNAGVALEAVGRPGDALARYRRALELDPEIPAAPRIEQLERLVSGEDPPP